MYRKYFHHHIYIYIQICIRSMDYTQYIIQDICDTSGMKYEEYSCFLGRFGEVWSTHSATGCSGKSKEFPMHRRRRTICPWIPSLRASRSLALMEFWVGTVELQAFCSFRIQCFRWTIWRHQRKKTPWSFESFAHQRSKFAFLEGMDLGHLGEGGEGVSATLSCKLLPFPCLFWRCIIVAIPGNGSLHQWTIETDFHAMPDCQSNLLRKPFVGFLT